MKEMRKKFLSLFLALAMVLSIFSGTGLSLAYAEPGEESVEGTEVSTEMSSAKDITSDVDEDETEAGITESSAEETAETEDETETSDENQTEVLTGSNSEQIASKDNSLSTVDYVDVEITGKDRFSSDYESRIEILLDEDLKEVTSDLNAFLEDKDVDVKLPLSISVLKGDEEANDFGEATVKVHMLDAGTLEDSTLYHLKDDGKWEELKFDVSEGTEDEMSYVQFKTESFSPFVFAEVKEKRMSLKQGRQKLRKKASCFLQKTTAKLLKMRFPGLKEKTTGLCRKSFTTVR